MSNGIGSNGKKDLWGTLGHWVGDLTGANTAQDAADAAKAQAQADVLNQQNKNYQADVAASSGAAAVRANTANFTPVPVPTSAGIPSTSATPQAASTAAAVSSTATPGVSATATAMRAAQKDFLGL